MVDHRDRWDDMNAEIITQMLVGEWTTERMQALFELPAVEAIGMWASLLEQYCGVLIGVARAQGKTPLESWQQFRLFVAQEQTK